MMRRSAFVRWAVLVGIAATIAVGGAFGLRGLGAQGTGEKSTEAVAASVQTKTTEGQTRVLAPSSAQQAGGLETRVLVAASARQEIQALANVVALQPLIDQRRSIVMTTLDARRAALAAAAADLEARRLGSLNADGKLVSDKALEVARTTAATEAANVAAARSQVALATATLTSQFGPVIAGWLVHGAAPLDRLVSGRAVLLQISPVLSRALRTLPGNAELQLPDGSLLRATIVSAAAQVDPKFQTTSYYATAPANPTLVPGAAIAALLSNGEMAQGVAVPEEAVVRTDGRPYVYVAIAADQFARREIVTDTPIAEGWLVRSGLAPGTHVVVRGAQLLLSQEGKTASNPEAVGNK
ncbi:hypothetical protein [Variovorax sp. LG9.2]|uniref:hypothetical protein n=1 Tax=Variovorax sp. LG9.2 TaxID=3048626 RepID=UPI002B22FD67|nr:hypothetical protein [Variovorax sp. LG9.2]MEB0056210.1 hypothetical protein [Variovorax sp. LG9.2]